MILVVMGVSGSGKTTVGEGLAKKLGVPFYDADDFHPASNVEKMSSGVPLTDADREPWLKILSQKLASGEAAVLACSALKESYRQLLNEGSQKIQWVYLKGSKDVIRERMQERKGHYMKASMLDSQFATLEEPEYGIHTSVEQEPEKIVAEVYQKLKNTL